jgi:branched-chain amino acid transport system permease protein
MDPSRSFLIQQLVFGCLLIAVMLVRPSGAFLEKPARFVRRAAPRGADSGAPQRPQPGQRPATTPVLRADGLQKRFGGVVATNGFSFELRDAQVVGLIGPNGAGKTTLFNLLTGALRKDAGTVELFGKPITRNRMDVIAARGLARSFQDVRLWPALTALENVFLAAYGAERRSEQWWRAVFSRRRLVRNALITARASLQRVGLDDKAMAKAGDLSHGEQKLVAFARLLAADTSVLLLDEPTAGVGPDVSRKILALVKGLEAEGKSVLIVEHNLDVMREVAQWCYFMDQGAVVREGTYADLAADPLLVASYFGTGQQSETASAPAEAAEANS